MDNNTNNNIEVGQPQPGNNAERSSTPGTYHSTAPYYNGVPPFSGAENGAPNGYYSPSSYRGNGTPWRDPEYHSAAADNSKLYSPTSGYYGYNSRPEESRTTQKKGGFRRIAVAALICALVSAAATGTVLWIHDNFGDSVPDSYSDSVDAALSEDDSGTGNSNEPGNSRNPGSGNPDSSTAGRAPQSEPETDDNTQKSGIFTSTTEVSVTGSELSATQIYELACEQVVGINLSVTTSNVFGQSTSTACVGTGFVISEDGYILTCYHVVEYAMRYGYDISVLLHDETEYPAELVGYDEDGDLAVLKINVSGMNPVTIGSSGDLKVGETIYAVGNPLGELTYTMTDGIVSALNREISTDISSSLYVFQINAAVNSGNSGGPVYDTRGMVVGIVDAKYADTGVEGLSFALPIDTAYRAALEIISTGYVSGKAQLGITCRNASEVIQSFAMHYYNIPDGAIVVSVTPGSAAEKAGLRENDIIAAINGTAITNTTELKSALREYSPGDTITLTVYRLDTSETIYIDVVLDEYMPSMDTAQG